MVATYFAVNATVTDPELLASYLAAVPASFEGSDLEELVTTNHAGTIAGEPAGLRAMASDLEKRLATRCDDVVGRDGGRRNRDLERQAAPDFHNDIVDLIAAGERFAVRPPYSGHHNANCSLRGSGPAVRGLRQRLRPRTDERLTSVWILGDIDALRQLTGT